jgi:murein tripeptide amidase MpaA
MTFLKVPEIESALTGLHNAYPTLTQLITLPNDTYEGRTTHALAIQDGTYRCRPALVFISGAHAREWGGPDILVNLAADILEAYTTNAGLGYSGKTFGAAEIRDIVRLTTIVVYPDINPDGRAYSMAAPAESTQACWRKNRNPASSGGVATRIGVDVNRNYDFLWDFPTKFSANANMGTLASTDPGSDLFHGAGPFSEPESRNVQWLVDSFPNAGYFVDVHSYTGDVLHAWGDDENQSTDPSKWYGNPAWDHQRGVANDAYSEYISVGRSNAVVAAANVIRDGINAVRGQGYVAKQAFWLWGVTYPTSGASDDWASAKGLNAFVIEFNKIQDFFPTWPEMVDMIADVDAGLLALCSAARPSIFARILCWFRAWWDRLILPYWARWHRVFPPELWGPYGPWGRVEKVVRGLIDGVVAAVRGVLRGGGR